MVASSVGSMPPTYQTMRDEEPPAAPAHSPTHAVKHRVVRLSGVGSWISIGGLYSSYDEEYPAELASVLSQEDFDRRIRLINDNLANNAPCFSCQWAQYCCCPCTLGLSILCVRSMCMDEARRTLLNDLRNANWHADPQIAARCEWRLRESCCDSWIEIETNNR